MPKTKTYSEAPYGWVNKYGENKKAYDKDEIDIIIKQKEQEVQELKDKLKELGNNLTNSAIDKDKQIEKLQKEIETKGTENHLMGCMIKELELRLKKSEDMLANVSSQLATKDHEWEEKIKNALNIIFKTYIISNESKLTSEISKKLILKKLNIKED